MPTNYSGRVTLIIVALLAALWAIFPSGNFRQPNLKPGIDMVGGTSLLYEIKPPEGTERTDDLVNRVMDALKKRVDPQGVRNLIWRPQGERALEIQMPLSGNAEQAGEIRKVYVEAQSRLNATNVRPAEVMAAVKELSGEERRKKLNELAMGSPARAELFDQLATAWQKREEARQAKNAAAQADAESEFDALVSQVDDTNLTVGELEGVLTASQQTRDAAIQTLKQKYANFPQRLAAIDRFQSAYADFSTVKGTIDDAGELKRLLKGSGVLEFHILVTDASTPQVQGMMTRLQEKGPAPQAGDTMRWFGVDRPEEFPQAQVWNDKRHVLAYVTPDKSMVHTQGAGDWQLKSAYPSTDQMGVRVVGFEFDTRGAVLFGELTRINENQQLAIVLDDKIISAPNINEPITTGSGQISGGSGGGFTPGDLNYLINTLNAGGLPAQLADEPIREQTIGPQLGQENLRRGLLACALGLAVVAVFTIIYYHAAGVVAVFGLVMNIVLVLGVMALLDATFTLPAVAGLVLTIGIAVDSSVLIYERLREEQLRGLSLKMALTNAYDRAFSAIVDSNITTAITCVVLYWFGSEEVKGFGLTLLLGLISSLFTSLFVSKTILGIWIEYFGLKKLGSLPLSFPKWDRLLKPDVDWMSKAWIFVTASLVLIVVGMVALVAKSRQGQMLDIEFASGTSVQLRLKEPMSRTAVQELIDTKKSELPAANVVTVGGDDLEYAIVTPNEDAVQVRKAILDVLQDRLTIDLPSTFQYAGRPLDEAMNEVVLPITPDTPWEEKAGFTPPDTTAYQGGAAIVLKDLSPKISPSDIRLRISSQQLQARSGGDAPSGYPDFTVTTPAGNDDPTDTAVILVSSDAIPYGEDPGKWEESLVGPMWKLVNEAVNNPAELQGVTNFRPQVAGDMQNDAMVAMTLSLIAIMVYIWLRFGNLKYGAATVVAILHDVLMVISAIGVSHYLANTFLGDALLIHEGFRVNLTLVAAVLTVMGYSMVDTVVVFDRIRENRGKFGHLSRRIVNDSINQTLSRTLLTGGTTMMTLVVMYLVGGPGIHGFTFVLLIGILVGTYSSIAIAAPILLFGARQSEGKSDKSHVGQLQQAER